VFQQFRRIWQKMGPPQRALLVVVAALAVIGTALAAFWGSRPAFRLLKGGLDRETAAKALSRLDEAGVRYRLENDGRDVLVDVKDFDKAQTTLVQNQIVTADEGGGYRGLEGVSFGLTEEQQKLRMRIALEEEIARSLRQFDGVESAKVHLTSAEKSFTRRDSAPAKASVILRLRAGKVLDDVQAETMARLVANASPGLLPEHVILSDTRGTLLSRASGSGAESASALNQTRMREHYLADKAQSALDAALGPDHAIVRVDVVMETERVESTKTGINPEVRAVLQEKISSSEDSSKAVGGPVSAKAQTDGKEPPQVAKAGGSSTEDTTTTYDYERETVHTTREKTGAIKRLTVGVLVDESFKAQKAQIEEIVKGSVGYDEEGRKDFLKVEFVPFAAKTQPEDQPDAAPATPAFRMPPVIELVKWGVTGVVAITLAFVVMRSIRTARASVRVALAEAGREQKNEVRRVDPSEHISQEIERDAQAVGRLLRNWLYETSSRN
jgi:flagellar M-ring protein FliF